MEEIRQFFEGLVKLIVEDPDAVRVEMTRDELGVLLSLHVAQKDMGQVIGRDGATANALRTLIRIMGSRQKATLSLKIIEPEGSTFQRKTTD